MAAFLFDLGGTTRCKQCVGKARYGKILVSFVSLARFLIQENRWWNIAMQLKKKTVKQKTKIFLLKGGNENMERKSRVSKRR